MIKAIIMTVECSSAVLLGTMKWPSLQSYMNENWSSLETHMSKLRHWLSGTKGTVQDSGVYLLTASMNNMLVNMFICVCEVGLLFVEEWGGGGSRSC